MIKQVYFANSAYSMMTYLLQVSKEKGESILDLIRDTLFVMGGATRDAQIPEENKIILNENEDIGALKENINLKTGWRDIPFYINARTPYSESFIEGKENITILSDGLSDKDTFPDLVKKSNVKKLMSTKDTLGDITDPKIQFFDVSKLWSEATDQNRSDICKTFNVDMSDLVEASKRKVILVTQPLSEDNMESEAKKIELYHRIVDEYDEDQIVIKPHPREKTNWKDVFPGVPVIPKQIPMELLTKIIPSDDVRVATFFSTAALGSVSSDRVDVYAGGFKDFKAYHPNTLNHEGHKSLAVSDVEHTFKVEDASKEAKKCNLKHLFDQDGYFKHPKTLSNWKDFLHSRD